jgi:hypothetical protein
VVADFSDLRKLHILTDKLRRLAHILKMNIRIGCQLKKEMSKIHTASSPALHNSFEKLELEFDSFLLGQETSLDRIATLIARSSGIGQLVSSPSALKYSIFNRAARRCKAYKTFEQRKQANRWVMRCKN